MTNKNAETLASFIEYCNANPEQRFWQALRNWSSFAYVFVSNGNRGDEIKVTDLRDTFHFFRKTE